MTLSRSPFLTEKLGARAVEVSVHRPYRPLEDRSSESSGFYSQDCPGERRHQHEPWLTQLPLGLIKGLLKAQAGIGVGKLKDVGVGALGPGGAQLQLGGWEGQGVAQGLLF